MLVEPELPEKPKEKQWFSWWLNQNYQKNKRNTRVFMLVEPRRIGKPQKNSCFQGFNKWEAWKTRKANTEPMLKASSKQENEEHR